MPSALHVAATDDADLIVVGMGPGVVGTGSRPRHHRRRGGEHCLDHAAALGGRPVSVPAGVVRRPAAAASGVSHHSRTALELVRSPVHVPAHPDLEAPDRHTVHPVPDLDVPGLLAAHDLQVTTMGRPPEEDADFFLTAGQAGTLAVQLIGETDPAPGAAHSDLD